MDQHEIALSLVAASSPPLLWLFCAAFVSICKNQLETLEYGRRKKNKHVYMDLVGVRDFVFLTVWDLFTVAIDLTVNLARTALAYIPLFVILALCVPGTLLMLRYNREIILVVDTAYEFVRPNVLQTILQILNFCRVLYALLVGVWNAFVDITLIPMRLLFDSAYQCGGKEFVRQVALSGSEIVKEFCRVVAAFFVQWGREDVFDVDVTTLSMRTREFLQKFMEIIECSCEPLTSPQVTRTVAYPLWSNTTDVLINNVTRAVLKTIQIPYDTVTKIETSFDPLFDVVLEENTGVLASAASLSNEYFSAITDFVQSDMDASMRFSAPPIFSLAHRAIAVPLEIARTTVKSVAALPIMILNSGTINADKTHEVGSSYLIKRNFNAFFDVLFVDTLSTLHSSFAAYGRLLADTTHIISETMEMTYNFTLDGAVGIPNSKYKTADGAACVSELRFTNNVFDRTRYAFTSGSIAFTEKVVPLAEAVSESFRRVVARDLLLTPTAEVLHSWMLTKVYELQSLVNTVAYLSDALLRFAPVTQNCMQQIQARYWEQMDDTLTAFPNIFTSLIAFDETNDSGYSNLVCARSTHVNHVYSGSLKSYVFASKACATKYDGTNVYPKCSYRHENTTLQEMMCSKLIAFADYNTNPLCAGGDELAELFKSYNMVWRTFVEYLSGIFVAVWNCLANLGNNPTAGELAECMISLRTESRPSDAVYDLLECQTAELVYRFSVMIVSRWSPAFDVFYKYIGYPHDGYYAAGVDQLQHSQARPMEAAFATAYTSFMNIVFFYPIHMVAEGGRDINAYYEKLLGGDLDLGMFSKLRVTLQINVMRSSLLSVRDVVVGILEFVR